MPVDYSSLNPTDRQRLPEYKREDKWIREFLHRGTIGYVGHVADSQPFITPTNYLFDEDNHQIIFHSNVTGRTRSNIESQPLVCFVTSEYGRMLPSNAALEFSTQYRSVMVFGKVEIVVDDAEKQRFLEKLIAKYFPDVRPGLEYRPITQKELDRTTVYAIRIESWSGKENWQDIAEQTPDWPPLPENIT